MVDLFITSNLPIASSAYNSLGSLVYRVLRGFALFTGCNDKTGFTQVYCRLSGDPDFLVWLIRPKDISIIYQHGMSMSAALLQEAWCIDGISSSRSSCEPAAVQPWPCSRPEIPSPSSLETPTGAASSTLMAAMTTKGELEGVVGDIGGGENSCPRRRLRSSPPSRRIGGTSSERRATWSMSAWTTSRI